MDLNFLAKALAIIAGLMHVIAFAIYNRQMLKKDSEPNIATWTIWSFLTVINFRSYEKMSGDMVKSILPTASSIACIITFLYTLYKGKFEKVDIYDLLAIPIGIIAGVFYFYYSLAMYANLILQFAVLISFWPTWRGVWKDPKKEKSLPWIIWTSAYTLQIGVVYLRWTGQYEDLAYPVCCFFWHAFVPVFKHRKKIIRLLGIKGGLHAE